jgi:5-(carboxyamino)imidazole ribonucleotide synthase
MMKNKTIGILGGGQLGRMLIQKGLDFGLNFRVMDPDPAAPCSVFTGFQQGVITDFEQVKEFGESCDVITIEIENVNVEALKYLRSKGKEVYPQPEIIETIQDKRIQKQFYTNHGIPTSAFHLINSKEELLSFQDRLPVVQKLGKEGYDGRGVQIIRTLSDLDHAFDKPSLIEDLVNLEMEVAVIVARNKDADVSTFPPVEMVFHPEHNLVDYLLSPARVSEEQLKALNTIAIKLAEAFELIGILAVEFFIDKNGNILVNESAPRPHNSGHQTIEANVTSQYEQLLRAILNWPLGDTSTWITSGMVNVLGHADHEGEALTQFGEALTKTGVFPHIYGKKMTKPFRKMGHATVVGDSPEEVEQKIEMVRKEILVVADKTTK